MSSRDDFHESGAMQLVRDVKLLFQEGFVALCQDFPVYGLLQEQLPVLGQLHGVQETQHLQDGKRD